MLKAFAATVGECLRPSDLLGRLGGEEFVVLLAEPGSRGAEIAAERIRAAIAGRRGGERRRRDPLHGQPRRRRRGRGAEALQNAMDRADTALYAAKAQGRDRVALGAAPNTPEGGAPSGALAAA